MDHAETRFWTHTLFRLGTADSSEVFVITQNNILQPPSITKIKNSVCRILIRPGREWVNTMKATVLDHWLLHASLSAVLTSGSFAEVRLRRSLWSIEILGLSFYGKWDLNFWAHNSISYIRSFSPILEHIQELLNLWHSAMIRKSKLPLLSHNCHSSKFRLGPWRLKFAFGVKILCFIRLQAPKAVEAWNLFGKVNFKRESQFHCFGEYTRDYCLDSLLCPNDC